MIFVIKYNGETICSSLGNSAQMLYSASLDLKANEAGTLTFSLPYGHQSYGIPEVSGGIVSVERTGSEIWCGRVSKKVVNSLKSEIYTCEGIMSIFDDVPISAEPETTMLLSTICALITSTTWLTFAAFSDFGITIKENMKSVKDALSGYIKDNGGYIYVKRSGGTFYVYKSAGAVKTALQEIREGYNITDIQLVTERTGFDAAETSMTISAFDMAYKDDMTRPFDLLDAVHVESSSFGVSAETLLTEIKTELSNPSASKIQLGKKDVTITSELAKNR